MYFFFFKQKTAYEMRISDWSSDVCSSDLDDDLPKDFDARREAYYTGLNLTADARAFSSAIREELAQGLLLLNANIPRNDKVRLLWRGENRISLTPFKPLPEPRGLASIIDRKLVV